MKNRGRSVEVVSLASTGPVGDRMMSDGIPVHACGGRGGWDARVILRLGSMLRDRNPRMIHSFLFHANQAARLACRMRGIDRNRLVCEIQTVEVERRWHLRVAWWTYSMCRFTIGNSPSVLRHLHEQAGIPQDRLRLVRGGVDVEVLERVQATPRASIDVPDSAAMLLWCGRLDPVKGLDHLVDALPAIRTGNDVRVVLAGDGSFRSDLEQRVQRLQIADFVRFLGVRNDIPGLLRESDLFVFPSRTEGLPNALLEAMALAKPIVTTDVPGCRDLIVDKVNGLLVPYGEPAALAEAIRSLLADPNGAAVLGRKARETVAREWTRAGSMNAYATVYDEVLGAVT